MAITLLLSDHRFRWRVIQLTATVLFAPTVAAQTSDWKFTPKVDVSENYTSNLNLTSSNEEKSLITEVRPGFDLSRQGRHLKVNLHYRLQYLDYSSDKASDHVNHQLGLTANSELIDDRLFLDASSSYSQQLISNRSASTGNVLNAPGNFADTFTFQITPRWRQRLGKYTTLGADFSYNRVNYNGVNDNSDGYRTRFFLDNQSNPSKVYWTLNADTDQATPNSSATSQSENVSLALGYRFSHRLDGMIRYGYVNNHLDNPTQSEAGAGNYWGADVNWTPTPRTTLSATYNSRLISGQGYGLTFNHRQKHTNWSLNYNKDISSVRQELLQLTRVGSLICPSGTSFNIADCRFVDSSTPVLPGPDEQVITVAAPLPTLSEEQFIQQSLNASVVISKGKSLWTLGAFRQERDFQLQTRTETDTGANAGWTILVSRRTSLSTQFTWSRLEPDFEATDYQRSLSLNMTRQITPDSSLNLTLRETARDSADDSRAFQEYRFVIGFSHFF